MSTQAAALPKNSVPSPVPTAQNAPPPVPAKTLAETLSPTMRLVILATVMAATLLEVLDTSIVNVAIPDMMGNLGATLDQIGWVSTAYIISNVIILPLTGWLSDYFGRKNYLTYSVILFTIASFGCGISHSLAELVIWRIIQGAGGAAFLSTSQATLLEVFPAAQRGFANAMFGIGVIAAPTLGPTLGGIITDHYSWPWIFFVNVPVGIVAAILTLLYVPNSLAAGKKRGADWFGIGLLAIGLGSLQTVLERGESEDWFSTPYITYLAIVTVIGLVAFVYWQMHPKNHNPAVNLRILKNRNLAAGAIYAFAFGLLLYGSVFILPQFLESIQHRTAEQTGLMLLPGGLATAAMMPVVGKLVNKVDRRLIIGAGMLVFIACTMVFVQILTLDTPSEAFNLPLILRGLGIGLQFVPLSLLTLGTLKPMEIAAGAGLYNLSRQLGASFGIAILATMVDQRSRFHAARLSEGLSAYDPNVQQRLQQIQQALTQRGMNPELAKTAAYKSLSGSIANQASVLTYMDIFHMMTLVAIGALLLLFLFQKAKGTAGADAAH